MKPLINDLIPQIIVTDTYIQDAYALEWSTKTKKDAVLLASYTWEADALKLASFDTKKLAEEVLKRFDEITTSTCGGQKISDLVRFLLSGLNSLRTWAALIFTAHGLATVTFLTWLTTKSMARDLTCTFAVRTME